MRFSRKSGQQFVASEKDGKATGWSAFYRDGAWSEVRPEAKKPRPGAKAKASTKAKPRSKAKARPKRTRVAAGS